MSEEKQTNKQDNVPDVQGNINPQDEANTASNNVDPANSGEEKKSYSEEDVQALIKEVLKGYVSKEHMNEVIQKEKNKMKKKSDESTRLAEMTKQQLLDEIEKINAEKEELNQLKEELEIQKAESEKLSKENALASLKLEVKKSLSINGLSEEYFDLVFNENSTAEEINAKIRILVNLINNEKKKEKDNLIKGASKVPKGNIGSSVMSEKEKFKHMNIFEKQALKNSNPELYKKLSGK